MTDIKVYRLRSAWIYWWMLLDFGESQAPSAAVLWAAEMPDSDSFVLARQACAEYAESARPTQACKECIQM